MKQAKHVRLKQTAAATRSQPLEKHDQAPTSADQDAAVATLVRGISLLAAHARQHGLGPAARILASAKEDMVYWAVDANFYESAKDRYIHHHLYGAEGSGELLHFLASFCEDGARDALIHDFNGLIARATELASGDMRPVGRGAK